MDLEADLETIEWLVSDEGINDSKPFVRAKFDAEREKGRKAFSQRLENTAFGYDNVVSIPVND